ncbi:MAG: ABC transporter ATP-binding protein [Myxococcota bacterium]
MIEVDALWKSYPLGERSIVALRDVSLRIDDGEFVAVVGSSGSGKSTLLNVLGLLDRWDSGTYQLAGRNMAGLADRRSARLRNELIGFVFQSFHLLPTKSAWENVALPLAYRSSSRRDRKKRARALLERLGLGDRAVHRPNELSGGQRQRVAIARALITDPPLILADEPTGNLDSQTTSEVLALLRSMHGEGRTVVVVTHDPEVAAEADRVITMRDAEVVSHDNQG